MNNDMHGDRFNEVHGHPTCAPQPGTATSTTSFRGIEYQPAAMPFLAGCDSFMRPRKSKPSTMIVRKDGYETSTVKPETKRDRMRARKQMKKCKARGRNR
jgi:hypothetical protein